MALAVLAAGGLAAEGGAVEEARHRPQAPDGSGKRRRQEGKGARGAEPLDQAEELPLRVLDAVEGRQRGGRGARVTEAIELAAGGLGVLPALGGGDQLLRKRRRSRSSTLTRGKTRARVTSVESSAEAAQRRVALNSSARPPAAERRSVRSSRFPI